MTVYYNENNEYAADWLENLIKARCIADGIVDRRSICDVRPADLKGFDQHHFFAGIGGWSRALRLIEWPDNRPIWTGSNPCQPWSAAGKQKGFADSRHLWPEWFRLICKFKPSSIVGEQVEGASGWLDAIAADLEKENYAFGAAVLPASCVGAKHLRHRWWFVAHAEGQLLSEPWKARTWRDGPYDNGVPFTFWNDPDESYIEPLVDWQAHGIPKPVAQLRALGNAIVPQLAAEFIAAAFETHGT